MHSSRMRTSRLLPVSPSMHCSRGVYLVPGDVPGPEGCTCSWGMYLVRGCTWSRGCLLWGVAAPGGGLVGGGACSGGCLVRGVPGGDPPDGYCCGRYPSFWNAFLLPRFFENYFQLFLRKAVLSVYTLEYHLWYRVFQPLSCGDHCKHTFSCLCIGNKSCRNSLPSCRFCEKTMDDF